MFDGELTLSSDSGDANLRVKIINPTGSPTVVFFPGWLSTSQTWRYFLPTFGKKWRIEYFESREKPSAQLTSNATQDFAVHIEDATSYLSNKKEQDYYVIASSIGATTYLATLDKVPNLPIALALISPNWNAPSPRINWLLTRYYRLFMNSPSWLLYLLRPPVLKFIKLTSFNKDAHHITGMLAALSSAKIGRAAKSAQALPQYSLDGVDWTNIRIPCAMIMAKHDYVHDNSGMKKIFQNLKDCKKIEYENFTETHSSRAAKDILNWFASLEGATNNENY